MVVRATRFLVGRCRQISASRCAGQRQRHSRNYYGDALVRLSAARCLATVAAAPPPRPQPTSSLSCPARPHSSSTAGRRRSGADSNSTKIRSPSPQQQQQGQQQRSKTPAISASRRALRVSSSSPSQCLQRQQRQEQYKTDARSTGDGGKVDDGGGVQQGEGDRSSRDGERFEEEEEEGVASIIKKESDRVWTVPNMITIGRIAFCPVLAGLIVTSQHELALAGLLAASLTDWLDGYIARKWKQTSVLGGFLDPLADKVMVTTVALALGQQGIVPTALVALMVGRDALLIAGSIAYRFKTRREGDAFFDLDSIDYKVTPSTLSKVNTVLQFGTLWLGLTNSVYLVPGDAVFSALCVGTGVATLASGVNYLLVSGLKPKGRLGKHLMIQRENLQERYREREVLVRERMGVGRERMRVRKGELNDRLKARRHKVAGALKDRMSRGRRQRAVDGGTRVKGRPANRGG
ncbi:unnamed protein product [Ectocarpus sp. 4 AP-2014]